MRRALLIAASVFAVVSTGPTAAQEVRNALVVDSRSVPRTDNVVQLAVDGDDSVFEVLSEHGKRSTLAKLGRRVERSGILSLDKVLPKGEIATAAIRKTLDNGSVMHAVMAFGFFDDHYAELSCRVYLFQEIQERVEKRLEEDVGDACGQVVLDDSIQDGMTLLVAMGSWGKYHAMYIYDFSNNGNNVAKILKVEGYLVKYFEGTSVEQPSVYVAGEVKDARCPRELACFQTSGLIWSKSTKKFVSDSAR